jgi:UDP:flavonoid glycosyltransferase YjiC (YdhE family)
MSNIVFMGSPLHGHTNPTLPVVRELAQHDARVVCFNHVAFRPRRRNRHHAALRPECLHA